MLPIQALQAARVAVTALCATAVLLSCAGCGCGSLCGNGTLDEGEECDDGNAVAGDGCSATCALELCGNGELDAAEECDDGNTEAGDGCSEVCAREGAQCGNLLVEIGEECEPPGLDKCDASCRWEGGLLCPMPTPVECGDVIMGHYNDGSALISEWCPDCLDISGHPGLEQVWVLEVPKVLDEYLVTATLDPNSDDLDLLVFADDGSGCTADCSPLCASSANGWDIPEIAQLVAPPGETLYVVVDSYASNGGGDFTLHVECGPGPVCGNGEIEPGEQCDDGNTVAGDDCDDTCQFEGDTCGPAFPIVCGATVMSNTELYGFPVFEDYPCSEYREVGPEITYVFTAPVTGTVDVTMTNELYPYPHRLYVIQDAGAGCDPSLCDEAWANGGNGTVPLSFDAVVGTTYYIVVETRGTIGSPFTLSLDCPNCTCGDGVVSCNEQCDEGDLVDGDGCSGACRHECGPQPATSIGCGTSLAAEDTASGVADQDIYTCAAPSVMWSGPELYYELVSTMTQTVDIELTNLSDDLDLFVLPADAEDCTDCSPAMRSVSLGTLDESVSFTAEAGSSYHVIVETPAGSGATFDLNVTCP